MKKLMKALAFATVMCMLLSTAAFAAGDATANMDATGAANVTVSVTGATESTPISIVVTDPSVEDAAAITSGNILYINQSVTDENGNATFPAVDTKGEKTVAVFLGYEGVGDSALRRVAPAIKLEPGDKVEILFTKLYQADKVGEDYTDKGIADTESDYGVGAVVDVKFSIDEDRTIEDMFWSLSYNGGNKAYVRADADILKILSGQVRLGIAVSAGSEAKGETAAVLDENGVNVIVKTTNDDASKVLTIFSDEDDKANEDKKTNN